MFERFTGAARAAVVGAQEQARAVGASRIEPQHLLLGLATTAGPAATALHGQGLTAARLRAHLGTAGLDEQALAALGIDLHQVREAAEAQLGPGALDSPAATRGHLRFTRPAKRVLECSLREALRLGAGSIGADAILLGLLREGAVRPLITALGGDPETLTAGAEERLRAEAA